MEPGDCDFLMGVKKETAFTNYQIRTVEPLGDEMLRWEIWTLNDLYLGDVTRNDGLFFPVAFHVEPLPVPSLRTACDLLAR